MLSRGFLEIRRLSQIRRLFSRIEVPPRGAERFRSAHGTPPRPSRHTLIQLGHIFSCSGNVLFRVENKQLGLTLSSVHDWIPLKFLESFGGRIYCRSGRGGSRPTFFWRICGLRALEIARILAPYAWRKTNMLQMFCQVNKRNKRDLQFMLKIQDMLIKKKAFLKHNFFESAAVKDWADLAHLLDCRGSIGFVRIHGNIRLKISHLNRELLESIPRFLESSELELKSIPRVHSSPCFDSGYNSYTWDIQGKEQCSCILRKAISAGLLLQNDKAVKILSCFNKREGVEPSLSSRYNHSRLKILTVRELNLSRLIRFVRQQARSKQNFHQKSEHVHKLLKWACIERADSKRRTERGRLRKEIRNLQKE